MIDFLKNAQKLPVFDWNICFFGAHFQKVNKLWSVPKEEHKAFECIYILKGIEELIMERDTFNLKKGDIIVIPPGRKHIVKCIDDMEYFCFHFDIDEPLFELMLIQNRTYYPNNSTINMEIKKCLQELIELINVDIDDFFIKMKIQIILSKFLMILYKFSQNGCNNCNINQSYYAKIIAEHLKKSLNDRINTYLNSNILIGEEVLVNKIINKIGLSEGYGSRIFSKYFGVSPKQYLSNLKLSKAKILLLKPNLSVGEISIALGYQNTSGFSRQFKKWVGISPDRYRKESLIKDSRWF